MKIALWFGGISGLMLTIWAAVGDNGRAAVLALFN